jgi:hypothetical protein
MLINSPNISGSLKVTGNTVITGSLTVLGGINATITGSATSASYVEYSNVANKPTLVSGSEQVSFNGIVDKPTLVSGSSQIVYSGLSGIPAGIVSGSSQISFNGIVDKPTLVSGSAQVTYSGLSGIPSGIVSSSVQIGEYGIFATTGSNTFVGSQTITGSIFGTGSLTIDGCITATGQIVAQTINVQQVTSSIVYSCGSNIFGTSTSNTQQFTGSMLITGSNITANVGSACFSGTVCGSRFVAPNLTICGGNSNALISSDNNEVLRIQGHCPSGMFASFMSGSAVLGDLGNTSQVFASGNATGFGINARGTRTLEFGTNQASRLSIASTGESTFTCQVCAPNATITNCLGVGVSVPQGNFEVLGLSYFTRTNNSLLINPNYGGANTHVQLQVVCNMGLAFATNGDCERMRITSCGSVGIGTGTVVNSTNYNMLRINGSTGGEIAIAGGGTDYGYIYANSGVFVLATQTNIPLRFQTNTVNRINIAGTGEVTYCCQVCAPQYITTQGSSVSYAAGTNYIVWNSEGEICSQDNNTGGTYTTMKTWIADRTGCLTLRFAGYIQSGANYFAWRVVRNGSTALVCGDYIGPLAPSCSTSVHNYTTFQSNIGPVNPGDCITLQMVSSTGGGAPVNGTGQFLFAKELRLHSTTPNFSAGSPSNIFGDRLGVGTNTPCTAIDVRLPIVYGVAGSTLNSYPIATFTERDCAGGARGLEIGVPAAAVDSPVYLKVINTSARFSILDSSNCQNLTIAGGNVGIGAPSPCNKLDIRNASGTGAQTIVSVVNKTNDSNTGAFIGFGDAYTDTVSPYLFAARVGGTREGAGDGGFMSFYTRPTSGFEYERMRITAGGIACFSCQVCAPIFRASNRLISNFTQIYNSDFTISTGQTRSVVICGGILTTGDFHLMMYGNAGSGMGSIRFSTYGYFANSDLLGFCEHLRSTFGSAAISNVSNNGTSISFNIANCSVSHVISGNWRMISTVGDDANQCLSVFVL